MADMHEVIKGEGGWSGVVGSTLGSNISLAANQRFGKPQEPRAYLSLSSIGTPCKRKLWYKVNKSDSSIPLNASTLFKFFYGDMIEELALAIAIAAGHDVKGYPLGLQIIGKAFDEQNILNIAYAMEEKIQFKNKVTDWWIK